MKFEKLKRHFFFYCLFNSCFHWKSTKSNIRDIFLILYQFPIRKIEKFNSHKILLLIKSESFWLVWLLQLLLEFGFNIILLNFSQEWKSFIFCGFQNYWEAFPLTIHKSLHFRLGFYRNNLKQPVSILVVATSWY